MSSFAKSNKIKRHFKIIRKKNVLNPVLEIPWAPHQYDRNLDKIEEFPWNLRNGGVAEDLITNKKRNTKPLCRIFKIAKKPKLQIHQEEMYELYPNISKDHVNAALLLSNNNIEEAKSILELRVNHECKHKKEKLNGREEEDISEPLDLSVDLPSSTREESPETSTPQIKILSNTLISSSTESSAKTPISTDYSSESPLLKISIVENNVQMKQELCTNSSNESVSKKSSNLSFTKDVFSNTSVSAGLANKEENETLISQTNSRRTSAHHDKSEVEMSTNTINNIPTDNSLKATKLRNYRKENKPLRSSENIPATSASPRQNITHTKGTQNNVDIPVVPVNNSTLDSKGAQLIKTPHGITDNSNKNNSGVLRENNLNASTFAEVKGSSKEFQATKNASIQNKHPDILTTQSLPNPKTLDGPNILHIPTNLNNRYLVQCKNGSQISLTKEQMIEIGKQLLQGALNTNSNNTHLNSSKKGSQCTKVQHNEISVNTNTSNTNSVISDNVFTHDDLVAQTYISNSTKNTHLATSKKTLSSDTFSKTTNMQDNIKVPQYMEPKAYLQPGGFIFSANVDTAQNYTYQSQKNNKEIYLRASHDRNKGQASNQEITSFQTSRYGNRSVLIQPNRQLAPNVNINTSQAPVRPANIPKRQTMPNQLKSRFIGDPIYSGIPNYINQNVRTFQDQRTFNLPSNTNVHVNPVSNEALANTYINQQTVPAMTGRNFFPSFKESFGHYTNWYDTPVHSDTTSLPNYSNKPFRNQSFDPSKDSCLPVNSGYTNPNNYLNKPSENRVMLNMASLPQNFYYSNDSTVPSNLPMHAPNDISLTRQCNSSGDQMKLLPRSGDYMKETTAVGTRASTLDSNIAKKRKVLPVPADSRQETLANNDFQNSRSLNIKNFKETEHNSDLSNVSVHQNTPHIPAEKSMQIKPPNKLSHQWPNATKTANSALPDKAQLNSNFQQFLPENGVSDNSMLRSNSLDQNVCLQVTLQSNQDNVLTSTVNAPQTWEGRMQNMLTDLGKLLATLSKEGDTESWAKITQLGYDNAIVPIGKLQKAIQSAIQESQKNKKQYKIHTTQPNTHQSANNISEQMTNIIEHNYIEKNVFHNSKNGNIREVNSNEKISNATVVEHASQQNILDNNVDPDVPEICRNNPSLSLVSADSSHQNLQNDLRSVSNFSESTSEATTAKKKFRPQVSNKRKRSAVQPTDSTDADGSRVSASKKIKMRLTKINSDNYISQFL